MEEELKISNIDTLVFDYGGVIVNLDQKKVQEALCRVGVGAIKQLIHAKEIKRLTRDFIDGLIPTDVTLEKMLALCHKSTTKDDLRHILRSLCGDLPESRLKTLHELKKRFRILLLSNINDVLWDYSKSEIRNQGYEPEDCFDGFFLSYEMGVAKPDEAIYSMMISEASLNPSRTLYFDDRENNYHAGLSLGFQSVLVPTNKIESLPIWQSLTRPSA